ncbi:8-oxo-dGTP pyrophosphatase MutT (NUDIX family) [Kitasatospora sp. GAS204A]|uniref:NUDIX hydrolase n=1 Tax=unclassified Kitasatospora TaxID=2633591 RepID=UPI00247398F9|nr:NUDIX domain-containing protein [Kitasatospora sp. GAS204B]MDH6123032.1 8-oxo-dGTP pyrophosphatase MutT (NUDIX family) [Kitasatospora sp. GAS204B]
MPITAQHVSETVNAYLDVHSDEKAEFATLFGLLDDGADIASRKEFRGHATAGAVLVNEHGHVLFIRHVALDKWLTPGGHLEPEDLTLSAAALRELTEETGIPAASVTLAGNGPVHIDVHPIPENPAKGEPSHFHIDFRFLFRTTASELVTLQEEEVSGYTWRPVANIADDRLRTRVQALTA